MNNTSGPQKLMLRVTRHLIVRNGPWCQPRQFSDDDIRHPDTIHHLLGHAVEFNVISPFTNKALRLCRCSDPKW
jgi:hypothetical protein